MVSGFKSNSHNNTVAMNLSPLREHTYCHTSMPYFKFVMFLECLNQSQIASSKILFFIHFLHIFGYFYTFLYISVSTTRCLSLLTAESMCYAYICFLAVTYSKCSLIIELHQKIIWFIQNISFKCFSSNIYTFKI